MSLFSSYLVMHNAHTRTQHQHFFSSPHHHFDKHAIRHSIYTTSCHKSPAKGMRIYSFQLASRPVSFQSFLVRKRLLLFNGALSMRRREKDTCGALWLPRDFKVSLNEYNNMSHGRFDREREFDSLKFP